MAYKDDNFRVWVDRNLKGNIAEVWCAECRPETSTCNVFTLAYVDKIESAEERKLCG